VCVFNHNFHAGAEGCDVSQSIYRAALSSKVGSSTVAPAILPGSKVWWYPKARLQLGIESLSMAGFPIWRRDDLIQKYDDELLQSLAGNAFSGTVVAALLGAFMVATPWACSTSGDLRMVGKTQSASRKIKVSKHSPRTQQPQTCQTQYAEDANLARRKTHRMHTGFPSPQLQTHETQNAQDASSQTARRTTRKTRDVNARRTTRTSLQYRGSDSQEDGDRVGAASLAAMTALRKLAGP